MNKIAEPGGDKRRRGTHGGVPATLASRLVESIRADIVSGVLAPNQRLRLSELSARYAAGAIPLREALSRLLFTGFVVAEDQRGFRVSDVSDDDLRSLTQVRQRLETLALRDSIEGGDIDWEIRMLTSHHRMSQLEKKSSDGSSTRLTPEWERAHREFHYSLVSACGSPWLLRFISILFEQSARYRQLSVRAPGGKQRDDQAEHKRILEAALARDVDLACHLLTQHFRDTATIVLQHSSRQPND